MNAVKLLRGEITLVDDEDAARVRQHRWYRLRDGYARACGKPHGEHLWLHRFVLSLKSSDPIQVDHIDGNRLNNQKSNLRKVSSSQNNANRKVYTFPKTSQFKGVSRYRRNGKWAADIQGSKAGVSRCKRLGYFESEIAAAQAYNRAAVERWGKFAKLNLVVPLFG